MNDTISRRPLKTRQQAWAHKLAHGFVGIGMTPNQMSVMSVIAAIGGAVAFIASGNDALAMRCVCLLAAAVCIQLRLLANMLDGLMAVEEHKQTPTGVLYNELPDRIADILFLVTAGYAGGWPELGWVCALFAVLTAYVRAFGGSLGFGQNYCGPMAKQHRMFALTVGTVLAALMPDPPVLPCTLVIILLGSIATVIRRTHHIVQQLSTAPHD